MDVFRVVYSGKDDKAPKIEVFFAEEAVAQKMADQTGGDMDRVKVLSNSESFEAKYYKVISLVSQRFNADGELAGIINIERLAQEAKQKRLFKTLSEGEEAAVD